jgi:hypothetical protein
MIEVAAKDARFGELFYLSLSIKEWDIATTSRIWKVLAENSIPWEEVGYIPKDVFTGTKGVGEKTWLKYKEGFDELFNRTS